MKMNNKNNALDIGTKDDENPFDGKVLISRFLLF